VPALALAFLTLSLFIISLAASPDHFALVRALSRLEGRIERSAEEPSNEQHRRERQAVEAFVSARFGTMIADENTWTNPFLAGLLLPQRAIAEGALVNYSNVSDADLTALRSEHPTLMSELEEPPVIPQLSLAFLASAADEALVGMTILYAIYAVGGLITAVLFRVGFTLRLFRVAIVTGAGTEASRGRTLFRSVVAWSPLVVLFFARQASIAGLFEPGRAALAGLLLAVGVTWAIARPARGLQDRIAGTWLVPR